MELSTSEENYIKAIFKITERTGEKVSTNALAEEFSIKAASVTDMVQRLGEKSLVHYEKYKGVSLLEAGESVAKQLIRKHRLWEVFLVEKLNFSWDEVHEVAEQLEHIRSPKLTSELDAFLNYPKYDPHGDPIPDKEGRIQARIKLNLSKVQKGRIAEVIGVEESEDDFLRFLSRIGVQLGTKLEVLDRFEYDGSVVVQVDDEREVTLSEKVATNLWVTLEQ
ncbi:MAG: metal-dependent transcriptional regulator [Saprospiraceae bacterium]|nr:metal-dependent transcriptional regulator [Saprospiraceae bacterium]